MGQHTHNDKAIDSSIFIMFYGVAAAFWLRFLSLLAFTHVIFRRSKTHTPNTRIIRTHTGWYT